MVSDNVAPRVARRVDAVMRAILRHWLLSVNLLNGLTLAGAALTPLLRAQGWTRLATLLYLAYRPLCPQRPEHSFFIAGYKMAFEQRVAAIYLGLLAGGLLFGALRRRMRPLNWRLFVLASLPMLLDVSSQTAGLRDSDWRWRTATGLAVALAGVWWLYPHLEREFAGGTPGPGGRRTQAELARAIVLAHRHPPRAAPHTREVR